MLETFKFFEIVENFFEKILAQNILNLDKIWNNSSILIKNLDYEIGFDPDNLFLVDGWAASLDEDEEIEDSFLFGKIVKAIVKGKNIDFPIEVDVTDYEDEDQSDRVTIGKMSLVVRAA